MSHHEDDDRTRLTGADAPTVLSSNSARTKSSSDSELPTVLSSGSRSASVSESEAPTVMSADPAMTMLSPLGGPAGSGTDGPTLGEGQTFGPYVIGRQLGKGGMGEVYEADHVETGRRVALKVLRGRLNQREDRARFLREGQLAASISHPHTVYIFGSEEIGSMPVIAMQLVTGGTLRDRVVAKGPLPVAEAVDAVLDIISGLDAAESAGILHRDIKPSNCFVDADGRVKVGDFGLSISSARDAGESPQGFQGTPQYAPPEQVRGEPLDVRADIYAVGATLFYLLTGRAPFDKRDFNELIEVVKTQPPPSPQTLQPKVPKGLAAVVLRCLAKSRDDRPASYADLSKLLRPYGGLAMPARRGVRLSAGILDLAILGALTFLHPATLSRASAAGRSAKINADPWLLLAGVAYFAVLEGVWKASIGKRMFGLRVASTRGDLTWRQALMRSIIYYAPGAPPVILGLVFGADALVDFLVRHPVWLSVATTAPLVGSVLLFATMTRKNGLAAVQDLLTGTRVVQTRVNEMRRSAPADISSLSGAVEGGVTGRYGTYAGGRELAVVDGCRLLDGVDTVLKRRVWILESAPGAPEISRARREADRVGRLHWLAGRRSAAENWDAFEAPQGGAMDPTPSGSTWRAVQGWLNDLAAELAAAQRDGTTPPLTLDRIWIRPDGRAVLLDFPAPGVGGNAGSDVHAAPASPLLTPMQLLTAVGRLALGNERGSPMPVSAVSMLDRWARKQHLSIADAQADLVAASISPDKVSRWRRLMPVGLTALPVVFMLGAAVVAMKTVSSVLDYDNFRALRLLSIATKESDGPTRHAIEVYLAGTLPGRFTPDGNFRFGTITVKDGDDDEDLTKYRGIASEVVRLHPTAADTSAAAATLATELQKIDADYRKQVADQGWTKTEKLFAVLLLVGGSFAVFFGVSSVLIRPSGVVLAALGLAVLTRKGREISRLRAIWRLTIAWSPLIVYSVFLAIKPTRDAMQTVPAISITVALLTAGVIWTALRPTRGPHDIVAGTRIGVR